MQEAKLVCGIIRATDCKMEKVMSALSEQFGPIDHKSEQIPFDFTKYYAKEMGTELIREWVSFETPIPPDTLKAIKLATIKIEQEFTRPDNTRTVNIDPGYLTLSNLVLASTKNYSHRIYLGDGIYAEVTLIYKNNHFHPLDWTYPDYRTNIKFFELIREKFKQYV